MKKRSGRHTLCHLAVALSAPVALLWHTPVDAVDPNWALCGPVFQLPERPAFDARGDGPEAIHLSADDAELEEGGVSILTGNVQAQRQSQQLIAERLEYDEGKGLIDVSGEVKVWDEGAFLSGESGRMDLNTDTTTVRGAGYMFLDSHSRGGAAEAVLTSEDIVYIKDADYTTCNPGSNEWVLKAKRIKLDYDEDVGEAWNAWLVVKDVPVFYTPYANFPLSGKRKSGFLFPKFRQSNTNGFEVQVPYYFNLAPNYDATLGLRPMTKRGVQLQGEFRYLLPGVRGQVGGEYLPDDDEVDDDRSAFKFQHAGEPRPQWSTDIDFNWVSDEDYLTDFGTSLAIASQTFLERRADLTYTDRTWSALVRAQSFQTLDRTLAQDERPYERLPQFVVQSRLRERSGRLNPGARGEYVNFERDVGVIGGRTDIVASANYPLRGAAWFAIPKASVRFTQYNLDRTAPSDPTSPDRVIPTASFDSGLFFERDWLTKRRSFLQTLEPRLFYLYVPFDNQDDLPVFDTGQFDFSFSQLFRENRFNGVDRVGDANQVSLALTSRLLATGSGEELARVSIGQIRYFRDREVTLPDEEPETSSESPLVADLVASLGRRWLFAGGLQWDPDKSVTEKSSLGLRYQPDSRRVVNLAYRFDRANFEQTDVSAVWPIARNWRLVGRWNYALDSELTLEAFGGLEYESCCWAFRTVLRRFVNGVGGQQNDSIFFQIEFKGLTGVGRSTVDFLERSIPGYENEF